jgi:hypothetical protein
MLPQLEKKIANMVWEMQMGHCKDEKDHMTCALYYKSVAF